MRNVTKSRKRIGRHEDAPFDADCLFWLEISSLEASSAISDTLVGDSRRPAFLLEVGGDTTAVALPVMSERENVKIQNVKTALASDLGGNLESFLFDACSGTGSST